MTGLERTLKSLNGTYSILKNSKYEKTNTTVKLSFNSAMNLALMALKNDIEMVEVRIKGEQNSNL
jgi:hypothetical protein